MERDGGVFLPEWQGWRNGAAKCMDEGGEGGEGGGEKKERERGDPMRGEKRKCEETKNQILRRRRGRCGQTRKSLFFWLTTLCVCLNCHFIIEHTHTHTAMITILHITGVQITAWLPRACQSTVIPQTLWIFISNKSSTARRHKEAFCCLLCFFPRPRVFFFFCRRFLPRVPTTCSTPSAFVKFNIRMIDDARAKRANRKSPESAILKWCWTETVDINPCVSQR